jgi:protoporphyrinogen oxidase
VSRRPRVGVVGAGVLGTVLALRLQQAGADVTLLERGPAVGGLAGRATVGGFHVDRFYHVVVPEDGRFLALADELGLGDAVTFRPVKAGVFADGAVHPLDGVGDLARLPLLSPAGRARLAWFGAMCRARRSYAGLEGVRLHDWLRRHCGSEVLERFWRPLLDSRFDGRHDELPATYLWSRTRRMGSARRRGVRGETMGALRGGHAALLEAAAGRAAEHGAEIHAGAPVEGLVLEGDRTVRGVVVGGVAEPFDLTIVTLQAPGLRHLLPRPLAPLLHAFPRRHLGVVCPVLLVRRPLLAPYAVNLCVPTSITTVVEAAHVVGTAHTGGHRLVYLPKYCDSDSPLFDDADDVVLARHVAMLRRLAPDLRDEDVVASAVHRARVVEPVHAVARGGRRLPEVFPGGVDGLALASAGQVYPRLLNGDSVTELAEQVAAAAARRLGLDPARPAATAEAVAA